jgi:hypothetical protein
LELTAEQHKPAADLIKLHAHIFSKTASVGAKKIVGLNSMPVLRPQATSTPFRVSPAYHQGTSHELFVDWSYYAIQE